MDEVYSCLSEMESLNSGWIFLKSMYDMTHEKIAIILVKYTQLWSVDWSIIQSIGWLVSRFLVG